MKRTLFLLYGLVCYGLFLGVLLYTVGNIDTAAEVYARAWRKGTEAQQRTLIDRVVQTCRLSEGPVPNSVSTGKCWFRQDRSAFVLQT